MSAAWQSPPGFSKYSVSQTGEVKSFVKKTPRLLKPIRFGSYTGYQMVNDSGELVRKYRHRLVLETFVGACPVGHECAHLDGDKTNNHVTNLSWVTHKENESHKNEHGTNNPESRGLAKINRETVEQMKVAREATGASFRSIARQFGVSTMTAFRAITQRSWK